MLALSCSVIFGYLCFGEAELRGLGKGGRGPSSGAAPALCPSLGKPGPLGACVLACKGGAQVKGPLGFLAALIPWDL